MYHYDENFTTLFMKVMRLATTASPWAENPMSRTRRFISNVKVHRTPAEDEFSVSSSLLISRTRYTEDKHLILTAERRDLLRRDGETFKLVRRHILADYTTMGWPNLAVFF
jgi:3-phenylpropionate/cinnamic acid dioxygenase small subunit